MSDEPIEALQRHQEALLAEHQKLRETQPFLDALSRLQRITTDFVDAVRGAWIFASRDPNFDNHLFWRFTDDLIGSALAVLVTSSEGIDTVTRRELRFMVELAIRNAFVDLVFATATTDLGTRMAYVQHKLANEDVSLLDRLPLSLYWKDPSPFVSEVKTRLYGELSSFVHPTHTQMQRRLALAGRRIFLGFETAAELEDFAALLSRTYDVLLVLVFLRLGPSSTRDLLPMLSSQADWTFRTTRFLPEIH